LDPDLALLAEALSPIQAGKEAEVKILETMMK
jgi:hypothetical protein